MSFTLAEKIRAEHRLREFLKEYGMPQPDEVEYGSTCVRFFFHEPRACVIFDLDPDADEDDADAIGPGTSMG